MVEDFRTQYAFSTEVKFTVNCRSVEKCVLRTEVFYHYFSMQPRNMQCTQFFNGPAIDCTVNFTSVEKLRALHIAWLHRKVICPLQRLTIQGAAASPGHALQVGESRKRYLHHAPCASAGISFIPLLFESLGGLSSLSSQTISAIGLHLGQRIGVSPADTRRQLYQKCSISLWRGNAVSWLHRFNTISPRVDGIT